MKLLPLINLVSVFICCANINVSGQENALRETQNETLDSAFVRVVYCANQQAQKDNEPFVIIDTMALDIGKTWSVYYDLFRHYKDSIDSYNFLNNSPRRMMKFSPNEEELQNRLESRQEIYNISNARKNGESALIYKNRLKKEIMTIDDGPMEMPDISTLFRFTEPIDTNGWTILEDTMTVMGYVCQKATKPFRGRIYTAWFTPDIPIDEGPWKLYGLPGLIMKAEDTEGIFTFQAIEINKLTNEPVKVIREFKYNSKGHSYTETKKMIGGNLKQWQSFRRAQYENVYMSFLDADAVSSYLTKNPITYPEMEIEE